MDKNNIWFITAKTNLHVGNENTSSYGLIDLAVQRNVTTGLPCINSSSLKGALNEYFAQKAKLGSEKLIEIFGCDKIKGEGRSTGTQKGKYTFFDANILFLPVQDDSCLYHLETSHGVIARFRSQMALFDIQLNNDDEDLKNDLKTILGITKEVKFSESDEAFKTLCDDNNLPIIARNVLENGESKNLWYEQVVPAEAVFYTLIDYNNDKDSTLREELSKEDTIVQIGANASVGYGYCKFTNLNKTKENGQEEK